MDGNYYQNPTFPNNNTIGRFPDIIPQNISSSKTNKLLEMPNDIIFLLNKNINKVAKIYISYHNANQEQSKDFKGTIEAVGSDYTALRNTETNSRFLIKLSHIDYIELFESVNYS